MDITKKGGRARLLAGFLKGSWHFFAALVIFSMLNTALNSLTPQIIRMTVDSVLGSEPWAAPAGLVQALRLDALAQQKTKALLLAGLAILITAGLSGVCNYLCKMGLAKGSENFLKNIRDQLFAHIQKLPFAWHVKNQTGEIIQRCTSDVEVIRNFVCNQIVEVFRISFLILLSLGIMFSMNVKISLIALAFVPAIVGYSWFFFSRIARRFQTADEAEGRLSSTVQENLTGVRVVRAFGREAYEIKRFDEKNNEFSSLWIRLGKMMSAYWGIGDLITGLQILTVITCGSVFAVHGEITLGDFWAFVSYNATLAWPIRSLGRILSDMSKAGVSIERVAYILEAPEEQDPPQAQKPPLDRDIVFSGVSFSYDGGAPVLKDLNFTIPAGKTFAILGGTGSGKSTLMYLLNRLYDLPPGCGSITIGGVDVKSIERSYLREHVGMVLQEPFLFSRTLKENIGITQEEISLPEIRRAASTACVDGSIMRFAQQYDTIVGERGVTLSGGQKQRVAIARMVIQNAPVLVFDDSLSAVDAQTDVKIRRALQERMGKATVILIAHRITTLMQADCIMVLENGQIAQMGSHRELIGQEGIYKRIYEIQMNSEDRMMVEGGKA